jgi:hypothetical protein
MKKYYAILIVLSLAKDVISKNDSLHFSFFGGVNLNAYYSKGLKISSNPVGFKFGFGISKDITRNFLYSTNIWYQKSSYSNRISNFYDRHFQENVKLVTNSKFDQLYWDFEVYKKIKNIALGVNVGFSYLLKSQTTQDVSGGVGITADNIYYTYTIYDFQKDSYYNTINPFVGLSILYFPLKHIGIKYENNFDLLSNPFEKYQYFNSFNCFNNSISLILKIK